MKKNFRKLFIIFGVLLCIFALYGCTEVAEPAVQSSELTTAEATETTLETSKTTAEEKETESTAEETISNTEETSAEPTETETQLVETCETEETSAEIESATTEAESLNSGAVETTENTSEESSKTEETSNADTTIQNGVVIDKEGNELIAELCNYLFDYVGRFELIPKSFTQKIDEIKNGTQPLHVGFDSTTSYYFICGYFNDDFAYMHAEEYTWVRFENVNEIQKYYNDENFMVAFQINLATFVKDILPCDRNVPEMVHYQLYYPEFVNGLNVNAYIEFNKTFIYLNSTDKNAVYYCTIARDPLLLTFPCLNLDGQYYIPECLATTYYDEYAEVDQEYLENHFGDYYDEIMSIMITGKYSVSNGNGVVYYYGLIPLEDFVNNVLK